MKECYVCCWVRDERSKSNFGEVRARVPAAITYANTSRFNMLPVFEFKGETSDEIRKQVNELLDKCFKREEEESGWFNEDRKERKAILPREEKSGCPESKKCYNCDIRKDCLAYLCATDNKRGRPTADEPWQEMFCQKGVEGCYCAVGCPYELMCPDCRDERSPGDILSYCICSPKH